MAKSRKELEHRQRRRYILECAEKLFAEKGFDGVTVADIAKASDFSVGSIYLFFEKKESLIRELLLERLKEISETVSSEVKKDNPAKEKLENAVNRLVNMFIEHLSFFKIYVKEVMGAEWFHPPGDFGRELNRFVKSNFIELTSIFEQGIEEGTFRNDVNALYMTLFLESCLHSFVSYTCIVGDELPIEKVREGMQKLFYHGILKQGRGKKK